MANDSNDFKSLLNTSTGSMVPPPMVPVGTYQAMFGQYKLSKAKNEAQTPFAEFPVTLTAAEGDVDSEQFAEFGGQAQLAKAKLRHTFYLTEDALFRVRDFVTNTLEISEDDAPTLGDCLMSIVNRTALVTISHRINQKTGKPVAEISATASMP